MCSRSKIGALIPIRLASERLPGKAIKKLMDKPVVCHLLDRAFASKYLTKENVIVCTTRDKSDDPLVEIVEQYGAKIYRGDTDDIIKRFYDAINEYHFDYIIQIDGDDITVEPEYMDITMSTLLSNNELDVVSCQGLPLGIASMSFSRRAIEKVIKRYKTKKNDTGFASYFKETDFCKHQVVYPKSKEHVYERVRLTLDYQEDFNFFEAIFTRLYQPNTIFHLDELIGLLNQNKALAEINYFLQEQYMERWEEKRNFAYLNTKNEVKII